MRSADKSIRERSRARREALAAQRTVTVSVTDDARWFEPFLHDVLPRAVSASLEWDDAPGAQTDLLVETPLRARDYGRQVPDSCVRMLISGEPYSVAEFRDHDLILDTKDEEALRPREVPFVYAPFYVTSFYERRQDTTNDLLRRGVRDSEEPADDSRPERFAAFLQRQCLPHRERFFDELCRYRPVDALGSCRYDVDESGACRPRATNRDLYTAERTYLDDAVDRYRDYRFVLALESEAHHGYVTEKLVNAMLAGAIPIYWGAPDVGEHFDDRSFVDIDLFDNVAECVAYIARLDSDEEAYRSMRRRAWLRHDKLNDYLDLSAIVEPLRDLLAPRPSLRSRLTRTARR
jgi:hypothetical protein